MSTTIFFVRHGHVHNPTQVFYGRLPGFRLSESGRNQARAAADYLIQESITTVYSSPMQRAQETAGYIMAGIPDADRRASDFLHEVYTPFDGAPIAEMEARQWDIYTGTEPPYEQPLDVLMRMQVFVEMVRETHPGEKVAAVTHADPIAFCALWALGAPVDLVSRRTPEAFGLLPTFPMPASVTALTFDGGNGCAPDVGYFEREQMDLAMCTDSDSSA